MPETCIHTTRCFTIAALRCMGGLAVPPPGAELYTADTHTPDAQARMATYIDLVASLEEDTRLPNPTACPQSNSCPRLTGPIEPDQKPLTGQPALYSLFFSIVYDQGPPN